MNSKKQRDKIRRRANRMAQQAWDAADDNHLDLAVRIIRRAVELNPANPVLWHDQGTLLLELGQVEPAAQAFQAVIQLAPDFAEAYASLAAIRARQGKMEQAVTLGREAARHAPDSARHKNALAGYEALLIDGCNASKHADAELPTDERKDRVELPICDRWPELTAHIDSLDWPEIDSQLSAQGVAHMPTLLNATGCEALRSMFGQDRRFAKTVAMNKSRFGKGVYRYFAHPIPPLVDAIRRLVYPHVSEVANRWQTLLNNEERYPENWSEFRDRCAAAGQTTPSPLMLSYETGGFNALHQDIRGEVFFPIQLVVVLRACSEISI
jgi:tetratricopeptide (TPR) repeat protein